MSMRITSAAQQSDIEETWKGSRDGMLRITLDPSLDEETLDALRRGARGRGYEAPLLQLIACHPCAGPSLLERIVADRPDEDVLHALVTGGRATAGVLDAIEPTAGRSLRRAIRLARFRLLLDDRPVDEIEPALADFADEVGSPAHYLAACHARTPRSLLERLARSTEPHVARAARRSLGEADGA